MELGDKLKAIRVEKKMTLDDVAKKSSLTKSFISQVELNKTSPSITSLMKVATALGIRLTDLFREEDLTKDVLIKKGEKDSYYNKRTRLNIEILFTRSPNQRMEPIYFRFEAGGESDIITSIGQEFAYVIKGKVKLILDQKEYIAEEGDCLYFDSSIPHRWKNSWSETAEGIWVCSPPII